MTFTQCLASSLRPDVSAHSSSTSTGTSARSKLYTSSSSKTSTLPVLEQVMSPDLVAAFVASAGTSNTIGTVQGPRVPHMEADQKLQQQIVF